MTIVQQRKKQRVILAEIQEWAAIFYLGGEIHKRMIAAPEGEELVCADFASIEARVLAWMANQQDVLEVFKSGGDMYKHAATGIYNVDYDKVTKDSLLTKAGSNYKLRR